MIFDILTIFPNIFDSYFKESILGRAKRAGLLKINIHNVRDYAHDKHKTTDDLPYGGGPGMVMKVKPIYQVLKDIIPERIGYNRLKKDKKTSRARVILLSARGNTFNQDRARKLAHFKRLVLICGRYEGVDHRIAQYFVDQEISIGDYVLTGGELPAMVITDAVSRYVPGVLGNKASLEEESFTQDGRVEYPQYTRPSDFHGLRVPPVLLSGDHKKIRRWREENSPR